MTKDSYVTAWLHFTNVANICVHKSTDAKFYRFTEEDEKLFDKILEDLSVLQLSFLH